VLFQVFASAGETLNPEAWHWLDRVVGRSGAAIVDNWWQTETSGAMLTPLPGAWPEKPGSATLPFFGTVPSIVNPDTGEELKGVAEGVLCIKQVRAAASAADQRAVFRAGE
jgi:acetyl-CoA synthetase